MMIILQFLRRFFEIPDGGSGWIEDLSDYSGLELQGKVNEYKRVNRTLIKTLLITPLIVSSLLLLLAVIAQTIGSAFYFLTVGCFLIILTAWAYVSASNRQNQSSPRGRSRNNSRIDLLMCVCFQLPGSLLMLMGIALHNDGPKAADTTGIVLFLIGLAVYALPWPALLSSSPSGGTDEKQ